jgi:acetyl esterase/lipase
MKTISNLLLLLSLAVPAAAQTAPQFGFAQTSYSVSEGGSGLTATVTRTGSTTGAYSLQWQVNTDCVILGAHGGTYTCQPGQAGPPDDYPFLTTTDRLDFADGETSKTFHVTINNDSFYEGNETFHIDLSADNPSILRAGATRTNVTIVDDDAQQSVTFNPASISVREGLVNTDAFANVTVTRASSAGSVTVAYRTVDGTAAAGVDYTDTHGSVTLGNGVTSATIKVPIIDNNRWEGSRTFTVEVTGGATATNHATVTIVDDESTTTYRFSQSNYDVPESQHILPITILREGYTAQESRIYVEMRSDTATLGPDGTYGLGYQTFAPGQTSKTVNVFIENDTIDEPTERFRLYLFIEDNEQNPHNPAPATVTIADDDNPAPTNAALTIADTSVVEGNSGTANAQFVVTLSEAVATSVSVHYETQDASAKDGSDYNFTSGSLTFAPGQTTRTINVPVIGDTDIENDEFFQVQLSGATGAHVSGGPGKGTIFNDDHAALNTVRNVEFARAGEQSLNLDLYLPGTTGSGNAGGFSSNEAASGKLHPLIVWIHGDHWADGTRETSPAEREAARGYVVASIDYRLSSAAVYPAQINDVKAAVRWLRANAARYEIDPNRIAVWGYGSGGHLAALLGTSGNGALDDPSLGNGGYASNVQAVVEWAAPLDLSKLDADAASCSALHHAAADSFESRLLGCTLPSCGEQASLANPATFVTRDDPPFLLMHGNNDCEVGVQQALRFADQLRAAGVDVTLKTYDGVGHTDAFWQSEAALATVDSFLDSKLKAPPRRRAMGR